MKYLYYPGCSAEASALEYGTSTLAVLQALGAEVQEIPDWTCCGASAAAVTSELLGLVLPARNLALAERANAGCDILTVCSACYTNFRHTAQVASDPAKLALINRALQAEGLAYQHQAQARHLLDILANDFTREEIASKVKRPLEGVRIAPYYGCQTIRPYSPFDNSQRPTSMVAILEALGAEVISHGREAFCCGTSLLMTKPEVGLGMVAEVLGACSGADAIATVCPMCHMNLDGYQGRASQVAEKKLSIPVLFLPQLMGLAFGLPQDRIMLERHVVSAKPMLERLEKRG